MYDNYFSNFSRPPVPNDICKDSATSHPRFWRIRFLNIFFPYKCIGKQTWPCHKKVKCQCTTISLAALVDPPSPMIYAKIQPQSILGSGEEVFKGFYHIWAWWPSWLMNCDHFSNLSFPQPKKAQYEIWAKLAQRLGRRFEILNIFPIQMHKEAKLTLPQKGQMSMYNHYFSNFGSPPVPDDICKDSATRHALFLRRRFLKVFPIQKYREANLTLL